MKSPRTIRQGNFKDTLQRLLEKHPEAGEVKNRYKAMKAVLNSEWLNFMSKHDEEIYDFIKDVLYVDRLIRRRTEDIDEEEKEILSQDFQLNELPKL